MCDPFSVSAALTVGSTAFTYTQQERQAEAEAAYASKRAKETGRAITEDAVQQFSQIGVRREQEADAAAQAILQISRDALEAKGTGRAQSGAGGVSGNSVEALINDFTRQQIARVEITKGNLRNTNAQLDEQSKSISSRANDLLFQNQPAPVSRPSLFGALFQVGTGLLGNYNANSTYDPSTQTRTLNSF